MALNFFCITGCVVQTIMAAFTLNFPDSTGKIVGRTREYVIRLAETPGSEMKTAEALFLIRGSPASCLKVISDFNHYPEFMPNIHFAKFVGKKDSCDMYHFIFRVAWKSIRYTNIFKQRSSDDGGYTISWQYVGGDLKENNGSWDISPFCLQAGYSVIRYKIFIDTGMFVPGWARNLLMAKSIPKMIKAISEQVQRTESQAMQSPGPLTP